MVIFNNNHLTFSPGMLPSLPWWYRQNQYWVISTVEGPNYKRLGEFHASYNGKFNVTLTGQYNSNYSADMNFRVIRRQKPTSPINYAANKTKGAFVYISHCDTKGYDRIAAVKELAKYTQVDLWGACGDKPPCPKRPGGGSYSTPCEAELHKHYRFFLAFENQLCSSYITEKFWQRLESGSYFIPVALGTLSVNEYERVAPPDSFLHVYNFTDFKQLGESELNTST